MLKEGITSLDLYRYAPTQFVKLTVKGAIISMSLLVFITYLLFNKFNHFFNDELDTEILFENLGIKDVKITFDIDILSMPCEIMEANFISRKGRNNFLARHFLSAPDKNGKRTSNKYIAGMRSYKKILQAYKDGEGCKISGQFYVHLVAQRFKVLFRNPQIIKKLNDDLKAEGGLVLNLSHKVNDLRIGEMIHVAESTKKKYGLKGLNTLKNHYVEEDRADGYNSTFLHSYHITAVPNEIEKDFFTFKFFQYVASLYSSKTSTSGEIVFKFDISPVTMHSFMRIPNSLSFALELLASIGGIFMVGKVINSCFGCCASGNEQDDDELELGEVGGSSGNGQQRKSVDEDY